MYYIIGGPTASGKSKLALWLAQRVDGEIINADSLQLYKNIPVLSAAPDAKEISETRHHLFGIYHNDQVSTAKAWAELAQITIEDVIKRHKTPIVVGGTGMYLNSLINGLSPIPEISNEIKKAVRETKDNLTRHDFYEYVISHDPSIKDHLHPNDGQRLSRALEVILQTGKSILYFQGKSKPQLDKPYLFTVVLPEKELLHKLINERTVRMLEQGAIQEVQALRSSVNLDAPVCKAIGVKEIWKYLEEEITRDELISLLQLATRQYAKRQITWFKNQVSNAVLITNPFDTTQINQLIQRKSA
ncbi:MAG: tRNA (adenosine(37)-N6)-dimethylallyltransferase MiaA [Proteobacteria bacterium]|nr:tRNA (adenosine(37)-N6)-dimethylallyltransferase MiaA [Pseudomonadota bacterium]